MKDQSCGRCFFFYQGRVALYSLLEALAVGPGDEVLVQVYTCPAVVEPILGLGAKPVFCDIEPDGFNLTAAEIAKRISARTKVAVVQHTFGLPADVSAIMAVARRHNFAVIEDCCHLTAAIRGDTPLGRIGDAAIYSFGPGKPISVGCGGAARVNSDHLATRMHELYRQFTYPSTIEAGMVELMELARRALPSVVRRVLSRILASASRRGARTGAPLAAQRVDSQYRLRMHRLARSRLAVRIAELDSLVSRRRLEIDRYEQGFAQLGIPLLSSPGGTERHALSYYPLTTRDKPRLLSKAARVCPELCDWGSAMLRACVQPRTDTSEISDFPNAQARVRSVVTLQIRDRWTASAIDRNLDFLAEMRRQDLL